MGDNRMPTIQKKLYEYRDLLNAASQDMSKEERLLWSKLTEIVTQLAAAVSIVVVEKHHD